MPAAALIQMLSHSFHPPVPMSDNDIHRSHYAEGWQKKRVYLTTLCRPSVLVYFSFVEVRWSGNLHSSHRFHFSITSLSICWRLSAARAVDSGSLPLLLGRWITDKRLERFIDHIVMVSWASIYSEFLHVALERTENEIGTRW